MGKARKPAGLEANDNAARVQLGPFWLWYRAQRDDWSICWYIDGEDGKGRRTGRKSTGLGGRAADGGPPQEAVDELAKHYANWRKPAPMELAEAAVEGLIADWLAQVAKNDADPQRAKDAAKQWLIFFDIERRAGRITAGPYVSDINRKLVQRFIDWRKPQPGKVKGKTVSGATISRELAALRATLRHAWQTEVIPSAPFIPDISEKDRPPAKDLVYTPEQVARLLEAAVRLPERWHVHRFIMIMMSTHGRGEAILELEAETQIRDGLIYFLAPGDTQTKKRRSIVPIAPTLAPWLEGVTGKVIRYTTVRKNPQTGEEEVITKPTASIKTAFEACLIEAGICEQEVDEAGKPVWLPPRRKLGETERRPKLRGIGSPNTLRHTVSTELHRRGVDERQIDMAAGHAPIGTNKKNYMHLRPDYLAELIEAVEAYWAEIGRFTTAHLRYQRDTNVIEFSARRAARQ